MRSLSRTVTTGSSAPAIEIESTNKKHTKIDLIITNRPFQMGIISLYNKSMFNICWIYNSIILQSEYFGDMDSPVRVPGLKGTYGKSWLLPVRSSIW